jgi:hypothetical protein
MHSTPAKPIHSTPPKPMSSSGGMKPARPDSPKPVSKPDRPGGYKDHDSPSPSPSKSKFLTPMNLMKMRKTPQTGGPKIRPDGSVEEYVQEETVTQDSGGSRGCGCPGCALGVLTTLAMLAATLIKLL